MSNTSYYREHLAEEREKLELELDRLGVRTAANGQDWDVKAPALDILEADPNEAADRTEEMHIDQIVLDELTTRYTLVCHALSRIEKGTYGTCEVCGSAIEEARLNANPAARTCKTHMPDEVSLAV